MTTSNFSCLIGIGYQLGSSQVFGEGVIKTPELHTIEKELNNL